jgi:uncharacterized OB-fold protein
MSLATPSNEVSVVSSEGPAADYFGWHARHEFRLQRCQRCRRWIHPATHMCPECGSTELQWEAASGRGTVFAWTITHHRFSAMRADELPYPVVIVQCLEGPRVVTTVTGVDVHDLRVGMAVAVRFVSLDGASTVAVFAPEQTS